MAHQVRRNSLTRVFVGGLILCLLLLLVIGLLVRQLVFGGTPTLHHTQNPSGIGPCIATPPTGSQAFALESQQSSASYRVSFQAAGQPAPGTVLGETGDVNGEFILTSLPDITIPFLKITVDLRSLDSGSADRDDHIRTDTFETGKYPMAVFTAQQVQMSTESYRQGQSISFQLAGELTLHGVTHPVTFVMNGKLDGKTVAGSGTAVVHLSDFGMKEPEITSIVPVTISKDITLTISFTALQEACLHTAVSAGQ